MTTRYYHISVCVRDMLNKADDVLCDMYRCGPDMLPEIRTRLIIALSRGDHYAPLNGICDNFDPAEGCKGHTRLDSVLHPSLPRHA